MAAAAAALPGGGAEAGVNRGVDRLASACFVRLPTTRWLCVELVVVWLFAEVVAFVMFKPPGPNVRRTGIPELSMQIIIFYSY